MPHERLIEQRLRFLEVVEEDNYQTLRGVQALVESGLDEMLDDFYGHILKQPELAALFPDDKTIKRARNAQKSHWIRILFARKFGKKQLDEMKVVGETHVRVGLGPSWYLSAYSFMLNQLIERIEKHGKGDKRDLTRAIQALNKVVFLDISFVIDSYIEAKNATMKQVLLRATRFTEDVTALTEGFNQTAEDLKASADSLAASSGNQGEVQAVVECSKRLADQVEELNERLDQLMYGDRLLIVTDRPVSFLTRVKTLLGK